MNLLDTLTRAADEEQLRLQPLPRHALAERDEHLRLHYALLLAALLHAQPATSEAQTRLLRLLLDALQLGDIRAALFEQARALSPEPLLEAARLLREAQCAPHLLLDALVLLRLDAPLGDDTVRLLGELASFLGLSENDLARRSADASEILGLHDAAPAQANATSTAASAQLSALAAAAQAAKADPPAAKANAKAGSKAATKASAQVGAQAAPLQAQPAQPSGEAAATAPSVLAQLWPGALAQPLSAAALRQGLKGGLWVLEADLDVDFPWQANDAILVFRNAATLNTFAKEGQIKLADCRLVDAVLSFQGACSISQERCDWQGHYDPALQRTALHCLGQALQLSQCSFATRHARALAVQEAAVTLNDCRFSHCGHPSLDGGALWHYGKDRPSFFLSSSPSIGVKNCTFEHCQAARGGAIYTRLLRGLERSAFYACTSLALHEHKAADVAVFAETTLVDAVKHCSFRQNSLVLGDTFSSKGETFVQSSQFQQAHVYFSRQDSSNASPASNCTFDGGAVVERNFSQ